MAVFFILVGILFYSLFFHKPSVNPVEVRQALRTERIQSKIDSYFKTRSRLCKEKLYKQVHVYADSLVNSQGVNPKEELDALKRPYRPSVNQPVNDTVDSISLKPLF